MGPVSRYLAKRHKSKPSSIGCEAEAMQDPQLHSPLTGLGHSRQCGHCTGDAQLQRHASLAAIHTSCRQGQCSSPASSRMRGNTTWQGANTDCFVLYQDAWRQSLSPADHTGEGQTGLINLGQDACNQHDHMLTTHGTFLCHSAHAELTEGQFNSNVRSSWLLCFVCSHTYTI